jgi:hypothetical protein
MAPRACFRLFHRCLHRSPQKRALGCLAKNGVAHSKHSPEEFRRWPSQVRSTGTPAEPAGCFLRLIASNPSARQKKSTPKGGLLILNVPRRNIYMVICASRRVRGIAPRILARLRALPILEFIKEEISPSPDIHRPRKAQGGIFEPSIESSINHVISSAYDPCRQTRTLFGSRHCSLRFRWIKDVLTKRRRSGASQGREILQMLERRFRTIFRRSCRAENLFNRSRFCFARAISSS